MERGSEVREREGAIGVVAVGNGDEHEAPMRRVCRDMWRCISFFVEGRAVVAGLKLTVKVEGEEKEKKRKRGEEVSNRRLEKYAFVSYHVILLSFPPPVLLLRCHVCLPKQTSCMHSRWSFVGRGSLCRHYENSTGGDSRPELFCAVMTT